MKYCLQEDFFFFFNYIIIFKVKCPGNIVPPSHPLCLHPAWSVPALGLACLQAELDQPSCDLQACAGCRGRPWEMCVKHDTVPWTNHLLQPWLVFTIQSGVPWPTALFLSCCLISCSGIAYGDDVAPSDHCLLQLAIRASLPVYPGVVKGAQIPCTKS